MKTKMKGRKTKTVRLQKILADAGLFSRRKAEEAIAEGRVTVNGRVVTTPGTKADPGHDTIVCDGKPVRAEAKVYLIMHKPAGVLCTCADGEQRKTVVDLVDEIDERVFPVGRLDYNTTGVLLLTNDGDFSQRMAHPSSNIVKTYQAKVRGVVTEPTLHKMIKGITVEGEKYAFLTARVARITGKNCILEIGLKEGKNHHIKILCQAMGHPVAKLARIAYGPLRLGTLQPGDYRHLERKEISLLLNTAAAPVRTAPTSAGRGGYRPSGKKPSSPRPGGRPPQRPFSARRK